MRFVLATVSHETNTFSPIPTPLASFAIGRPGGVPIAGGEAIEAYRGTNTPLCAFIDFAEEERAEILLPVAGGKKYLTSHLSWYNVSLGDVSFCSYTQKGGTLCVGKS